jgi:hypothetical protein
MTLAPKKRRRRLPGAVTETRSISLLPKWYARADAAVARGLARSVPDFIEKALDQGETVGIPIIDGVNDIGTGMDPPPNN